MTWIRGRERAQQPLALGILQAGYDRLEVRLVLRPWRATGPRRLVQQDGPGTQVRDPVLGPHHRLAHRPGDPRIPLEHPGPVAARLEDDVRAVPAVFGHP